MPWCLHHGGALVGAANSSIGSHRCLPWPRPRRPGVAIAGGHGCARDRRWGSSCSSLSAGLAFAVVGALLVAQRPGNPLGPVLLTAGAALVASSRCASTRSADWSRPRIVAARRRAGWAGFVLDPLFFPVSIALALLLFPDGRLPSRRWRPVVALAVAVAPRRSSCSRCAGPLVVEHDGTPTVASALPRRSAASGRRRGGAAHERRPGAARRLLRLLALRYRRSAPRPPAGPAAGRSGPRRRVAGLSGGSRPGATGSAGSSRRSRSCSRWPWWSGRCATGSGISTRCWSTRWSTAALALLVAAGYVAMVRRGGPRRCPGRDLRAGPGHHVAVALLLGPARRTVEHAARRLVYGRRRHAVPSCSPRCRTGWPMRPRPATSCRRWRRRPDHRARRAGGPGARPGRGQPRSRGRPRMSGRRRAGRGPRCSSCRSATSATWSATSRCGRRGSGCSAAPSGTCSATSPPRPDRRYGRSRSAPSSSDGWTRSRDQSERWPPAANARRGPGRGAPTAGAGHPRRRPAAACRARRPAQPAERGGPRRGRRRRHLGAAAAHDDLDSCIDDLRELARGIYPPVLTARGRPALRARARVGGTTSASGRPEVAARPAAGGRRDRRLLHLPRGAAERRQARAGGRWSTSSCHSSTASCGSGGRRRARFRRRRPGRARLGPVGHGGPPRCGGRHGHGHQRSVVPGRPSPVGCQSR